MLMIIAQILDQLIEFPTGFDVIADHVEQWLDARRFVHSLKIIV